MNRIIWMVIMDILMVPYWYIGLVRRGRYKEKYTLQQGYDFIRSIVRTVNRRGRISLTITGVEKLPEKDGFIMFPNHQGMFDVLAIIEASLKHCCEKGSERLDPGQAGDADCRRPGNGSFRYPRFHADHR